MSSISADRVKELRQLTGAGFMECKVALQEAGGDLEQAVTILRKKGLSAAAKRAGRQTSEGLVGSYLHAGGKIGVLVEVNCETDFVARTEEFKELVRAVAMHIAAMDPAYLSRDQVPAEVLNQEREIYGEQARAAGKPDAVVEKIVENRLSKFFSENCLLEQPFIKDPNLTLHQLIASKISKIGENIRIKRYARFKVGD
ncbi:MAG: translation elongation factor Ts [Acidobacteria bacterium]|nr:translation elongation factor Ts [Acidobacteriota bacterium]